jgi:hypothetical protein
MLRRSLVFLIAYLISLISYAIINCMQIIEPHTEENEPNLNSNFCHRCLKIHGNHL